MKKIFITGGSGFIGKNLIEQLSHVYEVYAPKHNELDLLNQYDVYEYLKNNNFDVVIHTATQNASRNAKESVQFVLEKNLRMFFNLAKYSDCYGKMIYYGSGAEYDMENYVPKMGETYFGKHIPKDVYSFSKYIMASTIENKNNIYDLVLFGLFGKYEDWEIRFISNALCKVIYDMPITIRKNVYFDYLYIDDLVNITTWFIENTSKFKRYNITPNISIDLYSIAEKILKISYKKLPIVINEEGLKKEYSGSNKRLINEIGDYNFKNIEKSIEELFHWYNRNKNIIDKKLLIFDK